MRTIKLAHGVPNPRRADRAPNCYKVVVVKNSTDYDPGMILEKDDVDRLCAASSWDVTIVRYNPELDR